MREYLEMVKQVIDRGVLQKNRTGVDTITLFGYFYRIPLAGGFPLITTKRVNFNAILREMLWYLSGESNIRTLREHTSIWNRWATEEGELETAYGRFWRRYPVPTDPAPGERWSSRWVVRDEETGGLVFDQIGYIVDSLKEIRSNPAAAGRRRLAVVAWHPGNASESLLPPCHYTFCFNVIDNYLNCHLTQRSGDIAIGIPFNIACYSLLTCIIARETGFTPGEFAHTIVDAHIYVDQLDGLKEQLGREPHPRPTIRIADKPMESLEFDDFHLENYIHHPAIKFPVAG